MAPAHTWLGPSKASRLLPQVYPTRVNGFHPKSGSISIRKSITPQVSLECGIRLAINVEGKQDMLVVNDAMNGRATTSIASCVPCRSPTWTTSRLGGILGAGAERSPQSPRYKAAICGRVLPLTLLSRADFTLVRASLLAIGGRPNRSTRS